MASSISAIPRPFIAPNQPDPSSSISLEEQWTVIAVDGNEKNDNSANKTFSTFHKPTVGRYVARIVGVVGASAISIFAAASVTTAGATTALIFCVARDITHNDSEEAVGIVFCGLLAGGCAITSAAMAAATAGAVIATKHIANTTAIAVDILIHKTSHYFPLGRVDNEQTLPTAEEIATSEKVQEKTLQSMNRDSQITEKVRNDTQDLRKEYGEFKESSHEAQIEQAITDINTNRLEVGVERLKSKYTILKSKYKKVKNENRSLKEQLARLTAQQQEPIL